MSLRGALQAALEGSDEETRARAAGLVRSGAIEGLTVRLREGESSFTVACEVSGGELRAACTCALPGCPHVLAALLALTDPEVDSRRPVPSRPAPTAPPRADPATPWLPAPYSRLLAEHGPPSGADAGRGRVACALADAVDLLVREVCRDGLGGEAVERDAALDSVLSLLREQDLPDLRRTVAVLRHELTSPGPDPVVGTGALLRLTRIAGALRQSAGAAAGAGRSWLPEGADRREEVRLLEVARDTQRTPFGDRRDVSYFIDLRGGHLFRELAASKPGQAPRMSDGPFPKLLVGNLVAIEPGAPPRRIRMLQYTSGGLPSAVELDRIRFAAEPSVATLYDSYREAAESHDASLEPVVLFAPSKVLRSPRGIVLADEAGRLLPLARGSAPALCETLDLLSSRSHVVTVIGILLLGPSFLSMLPLSVLLETASRLSLRQLR